MLRLAGAPLDGIEARGPAELSEARRLFARALETPGGLKIQTIHAFCESVLKRFPLEAGISPGFAVMEETEAREAINAIIDTLAERLWSGRGDATHRDDFLSLTARLQEDLLRKRLAFLAEKGPLIEEAIIRAGGESAFYGHLADRLGVAANESRADAIGRLRGGLEAQTQWIGDIVDELATHGKNDRQSAHHLKAMIAAGDDEAFLAEARGFALVQAGTVRKTLCTKAAEKMVPGLGARLADMAEAIRETNDALKGIEIFTTTAGLYRLGLFVYRQYRDTKARQGRLDFNDLIDNTAQLFRNHAGGWVLYKLDQGIEHVLVDEAQDTSQGQWDVIAGPLAEFFAGLGAHEDVMDQPAPRTVFVVGDEKQSIYSFQGADVGLFRSQQKAVEQLVVGAQGDFHVEDLTLSFRSTAPVLGFVDQLFNDALAASGVSEDKGMHHKVFRAGEAGRVELWPLVVKEESGDKDPWDKPVDTPGPDDPSRTLARHIAGQIRTWLDTGEVLESQGRPIRPGDILILCQRRGPVFQEIVRELTGAGIPNAGSDRVKLMDHVAARDLLAATRFCLQTDDDLSLAELLKSPLYGFEDEALFKIARNGPGGKSGSRRRSLWHALNEHAVEDSETGRLCARAATSLKAATATGLARGPYAFFTALLEEGDPSGWKRFYGRLGPGARDAIQELLSEALNYEATNPRSLQGFLAHLDGLETDIKKEIGSGEDAVRIMTVHGAKGLEAPIVFMADAAYANYNDIKGMLSLGTAAQEAAATAYTPERGLFIQASSKSNDNAAAAAARESAVSLGAQEYRRLLYVAATRAEDRLYVCGTLPGNTRLDTFMTKPANECSWYALAARAFERLRAAGHVEECAEAPWGGPVLRYACPQEVPPKTDTAAQADALPPLPDWLRRSAPVEPVRRHLSPSTLGAALEADDTVAPVHPAVNTPLLALPDEAGLSPMTRGNALHLLLERLPSLAAEDRRAIAARLLARHYPEAAAHHEEWTGEACAVLDDPSFATVFAPGSRAEVPVMGRVETGDGPATVSGQIDRLAVGEAEILIVDYKTNRPPPARADDAPPAYVAQLGAYRRLLQQIYPSHEIKCALLWTWTATLMPVSADAMDKALARAAPSLFS